MNPAYIVTTKRPCTDPACPCQDGDPCHYLPTERTGAMAPQRVTRHAAATLEEVRARATHMVRVAHVPASSPLDIAARSLPESGGTVGPLPDGATIDVKQTTWDWLATDAGVSRTVWAHMAACGDARAQQQIIDAYNAREQADR